MHGEEDQSTVVGPTDFGESGGSSAKGYRAARSGDFGALERGGRVGRYFILRKLGSGGMGSVYEALDPDLGRKIALKCVELGDIDHRDDMMAEARALAALDHPNVVPVYDVGVDALRNTVYLAMDLVRGPCLRTWLSSGRPSRASVLALLLKVGEGLAAVHARGIVHADIKPDNIVVTCDAHPVLVDFGLARRSVEARDENSSGAVRTVNIAGTPAYMAPELWRGRPPSPTSDQYALCITAFEALMGRRPVSTHRSTRPHRRVDLRVYERLGRRRDVPKAILEALARGCEFAPGRRFADVEQLCEVLAKIIERPARRRRTLVRSSTVAALLTVAVVAGHSRDVRPSAGDVCDELERAPRAVWNKSRRQQLEDEFMSTPTTGGAQIWAMVRERVEGTLESATMHMQRACDEHWSDSMAWTRRHAAFRRCLARVDRTLEFLHRGDAQVRAHAVAVANAIADDGDCRGEVDVDGPAWPDDPKLLARAHALRAKLDEIDLGIRSGRYDVSKARAREVLQAARQLGFVPMVAEAHFHIGHVAERSGSLREGREALERALVDAVASGNDGLASRTAHHLLNLRATLSLEQVDVGVLDDAAYAFTLRTRDETQHWAGWLRASGGASLRSGDNADAIAKLAEALEVESSRARPDATELLFMRNDLAVASWNAGRYEEAEREYDRTYERGVERLGPSHTGLTFPLAGLGFASKRKGDLEASHRYFLEAERITLEAMGPDISQHMWNCFNLARTEHKLGWQERALERLHECHRRQDLAGGPADEPGGELTWLRLELGVHELALDAHLTTIGHLRADPPIIGYAREDDYLMAGAHALSFGRFDEAGWLLERALPFMDERTPAEYDARGYLRALLARVYIGRGELDRARAMLVEARQIWARRPMGTNLQHYPGIRTALDSAAFDLADGPVARLASVQARASSFATDPPPISSRSLHLLDDLVDLATDQLAVGRIRAVRGTITLLEQIHATLPRNRRKATIIAMLGFAAEVAQGRQGGSEGSAIRAQRWVQTYADLESATIMPVPAIVQHLCRAHRLHHGMCK